jgi:hypothetical protein
MTTAGDLAPFGRAVSVALTCATRLDLEASLVESCLNAGRWQTDETFLRAWRGGLAAVRPAERVGRLAGVTGHVGESAVELILDRLGYVMLWHFTGPLSGGHGVDLLVLSPDGKVLAIEVKSTLRVGRWPRPTRRELTQMSSAWLDTSDNPGMANWDLYSDDVYGAVMVVNFASRQWRCVLTGDFVTAQPVTTLAQLADLSWLQAGT